MSEDPAPRVAEAPPRDRHPETGGEPDWVELLQLSADAGSDIARLVVLELRLAVASLSRMLVLALACLPLLLLLWLGLSLLPAAALYQHTGSISLAVGLFTLIQLLALVAVGVAWVRYRRTLGLPRTRRQLRRFSGEFAGQVDGKVDGEFAREKDDEPPRVDA